VTLWLVQTLNSGWRRCLGVALAAATTALGLSCAGSQTANAPQTAIAHVTKLGAGSTHPHDAGRATVAVRSLPASVSTAPSTGALAGKVVGIDPGHNGRNYTDPSYINHLIWNGREQETCDTTGTETDSGYTEAQFNFNVARYLAADLRDEGAKVILTRSSNTGIGPCVTRRAESLNDARADVAIDIHADGGPAGGRGFAILEPVADGPNDHVIAASKIFGRDLRERYRLTTGIPESTYDGIRGISLRDNLAGLNLTTVPKVLIECGNMRNATDASLLEQSSFQRLAAKAMAEAITEYLR
jgi:N-acetylmuramoyl-L-alanine amidase